MSELLQSTIEISKSVGAFLMEEQHKISRSEIEFKGSANDLVSRADKDAERRFVEFLSKLLPEAGFIAEEGTSTKVGKEYNWIIDPLDGTTNYLYRIPCWCTSVALQKNGALVLGVIFDPTHGECFSAEIDEGAFLNGSKIQVSDQKNFNECLVATGFPYHNLNRSKEYLGVLHAVNERSRGIRRLGSAALDMAYVACGRFEAFYEYGLHPWDCAAGAVIIKEAGGVVTDFKNGDDFLKKRTMISDNGLIHNQLIDIVADW